MQVQAGQRQPVDKWVDPGCMETLSVVQGVIDDCTVPLWVCHKAGALQEQLLSCLKPEFL